MGVHKNKLLWFPIRTLLPLSIFCSCLFSVGLLSFGYVISCLIYIPGVYNQIF